MTIPDLLKVTKTNINFNYIKYYSMFSIRNSVYIFNLFCCLNLFVFSSCEEDEKPVPVNETGTMTDVEGNIYKTVKIGNQWWMAENLKVTKYRDGSSIPFVLNPLVSWSGVNEAYCIYNNAQNTPGMLYKFNVLTNPSGLAPEGWHIPSDAEWKALEMQLGMEANQTDIAGWRGTDEGEKLKISGNTGWASYENVWATNESGFSAEAGSCVLFDGKSGNPGLQYNGFWWSLSDYSDTEAWYRHMDYKERGVYRSHTQKNYGFSVRCVKN